MKNVNSAWGRPVDFFARRSHFIDHMAPVWKILDISIRGKFYVPESLYSYALEQGVEAEALKPKSPVSPLYVLPGGNGPIVVAAYNDMELAHRGKMSRPLILMEHGVGLSFGNHPGYAGGLGMRRRVSLFLVPNEHTRLKNERTLPGAYQVVIGTPKLDEWAGRNTLRPYGDRPTVCISFHWNGDKVAAEAGNAYAHYRSVLGELASQEDFKLIGHGHPRLFDALQKDYLELGIEPVRDFREIMERADTYVNDCSSTLYEFCITGWPVILLNAPWFRKEVNQGIRFWEYSNVGPQVEQPEELLGMIKATLANPDQFQDARRQAAAELYPFLGEASARAANAIREVVEFHSVTPIGHPQRTADLRQPLPPNLGNDLVEGKEVGDKSVGILYIGFGIKAVSEIRKSMMSMKRIGLNIPVAVVGDRPVVGARFIPWEGESPFDPEQRTYFQFRAGRVKPHLYELSPFERTLYIDADTEFRGKITAGFQVLSDFDMAVTQDSMKIEQLYNKAGARWEYNLAERDATMEELGGDGTLRLFNSGVIFFKKCQAVQGLFEEWGRQWMRWQEWDEQLALRRALHYCEVKYRVLGIEWNHPDKQKAKVIWHNYAKGMARINVK